MFIRAVEYWVNYYTSGLLNDLGDDTASKKSPKPSFREIKFFGRELVLSYAKNLLKSFDPGRISDFTSTLKSSSTFMNSSITKFCAAIFL